MFYPALLTLMGDDWKGKNFMRYLERIANVAVIVAVVVFLFMVFRGDIGSHQSPQDPSKELIGKTITLPGVPFSKTRNSLVVVVSTACHFCKDSLPFYKQLGEKACGRLNMIAVLPQSEVEAQKFLQDAGVHATQVVSASLDSIGINGTPTVLLVNEKGKIKRAWIGKLDEKGQESLLTAAFNRAS